MLLLCECISSLYDVKACVILFTCTHTVYTQICIRTYTSYDMNILPVHLLQSDNEGDLLNHNVVTH